MVFNYRVVVVLLGVGPGEFWGPWGLDVTADGQTIYVADTDNFRVQYFGWSDPAVKPTSLGRVKALFR